jgi:hypothetical protein
LACCAAVAKAKTAKAAAAARDVAGASGIGFSFPAHLRMGGVFYGGLRNACSGVSVSVDAHGWLTSELERKMNHG